MKTLTPRKPKSAAAGWQAVVGELDKMCKILARRFHQDPLDVWGDVGVAVVHAHDKYDPARNPDYGAWVRWKVWEYLKGRARTRYAARRRERQPDPEVGLESTPSACAAPWPIDEWADSLPGDVRTVVLLAVGQPPAVRAILARAGNDSPANVRRAVRLVLKKDGWDDDRLQAAFLETRAAVAGLYTPHFRPSAGTKED